MVTFKKDPEMTKQKIPISFFLRRIQSLTGFFLVIFLFEHLLTNSTASLWLNQGNFFIKAVNAFQGLKYLKTIEITLIGIPIFLHASLGVKYITTGELNSFKTNGKRPSLYQYKRNKAYSWQRITSYIIGVILVFHVVQMKFINKPKKVILKNETYYLVKVKKDDKLASLAASMGVELFSNQETKFFEDKKFFEDNLKKIKLKDNQVLALTKESGQAFLLEVRNILKNPFMVFIYSFFVLGTSFHAFNGLWTFLMTWGFIISNRSQTISLSVCFWMMVFVLTLGFISI